MSEQTPEPETPEPPAEPSGEGGTEARLSSLEDKLSDVIDFIKGGGGKPAEPDPEPRDIKAEVREAVREVQRADGAKAAKAEEERSLKEQVGELKAAIEKPPEEFRRVTQRMGWNRP